MDFPGSWIGKVTRFLIEMLWTMPGTFSSALPADLPLFQLLTVFLWFLVCMAFQPFNQLIFHHQLAPADPQGWEIRAAQKVVHARFGNLQRFCKLLCVQHIGHCFKRLSTHKISFPAWNKTFRKVAQNQKSWVTVYFSVFLKATGGRACHSIES